jgi:hypothetical protein
LNVVAVLSPPIELVCNDANVILFFLTGYWLCYINSTINPVCYALCNANFRRTYWRILTCRWFESRRHQAAAAGVRFVAARNQHKPQQLQPAVIAPSNKPQYIRGGIRTRPRPTPLDV